MEALEGIIEAIPTITIQEPVPPSTQEPVTESSPAWCQRYHYLPPRQRAGRILYTARVFKRLTQTKLAAQTEIRRDHLLEMEQGFRRIEADEACALAHVLDVDYRQFLEDSVLT